MRIASSVSHLALAMALPAVVIAPAMAQDAGAAASAAPLAQTAPPLAQDGATPAQGATPAAEIDADENTIVVFGRRLIGQVETAQPPLLELSSEDVLAYGAGSIDELLQQLSPQVSSSRGRGGGGGPVILVNGVRISSFRELRSYPPEAIEKVEVFPEEVAQRYGYSADQRVVNFILKSNFSSRELEGTYGQPWDGGSSSQELEGTFLKIAGPARLNFNLDWKNSSPLTQAERPITQTDAPTFPAIDPDPARYRSLIADTAGLEATANLTTKLGNSGNSVSANATYERADTLRLQGLDTVLLIGPAGSVGSAGTSPATALRTFNPGDPLLVDSRTETYALGSTLNLGFGEWQVTGTADAKQENSISRIERRLTTVNTPALDALVRSAAAGTLPLNANLATFADAGADTARTRASSASALVTARGHPLLLPAGELAVTLDSGYDWDRIRSVDTRTIGQTELIRGDLSAGVNLAVPLTSRNEDFLAGAGDINLNLSAGIDHLSDFGTLTDWSAGITWGVTEHLTVTATHLARDTAPTLAQLGNPRIDTPNVSVYDFVTNRTVLVTSTSGGNPALPAQSQSDWKVGLVWELPFIEQSNISVDYIRNHSEDVAANFPVLTPAIEAAYQNPRRVIRDPATNQLISIDQRPVSFAKQDLERLQFGLNLSGRIGPAPAGGGGGGGRGGFGGFGRGAGGPGGPGGAGGPPPGTGAAAAGGGQAGQPAQPGAGTGGEGRRGNFDPARFQAMRQLLCGENGTELAMRLARGETVKAADGSDVTLPPPMLERLRVNGEPDAAQVEQFRQRICSADGPPGVGGGQGAPGANQAQATPGATPGAPAGAPPAGGFGGFGRGAGGPGGGGGGGRWFVNLQYTLDLKNQVLIAPGVPLLDLLDGDAITGGGQPRHSATLRLGAFYKGFGTFLNAAYTGASRIDGTGLPNSSDLKFADFATVNWRMFVDFGQQASIIKAVPLLDKTRLSFNIANIFDARQRVTDGNGVVPQRYQPFLVDPVGRRFEIELRKLF